MVTLRPGEKDLFVGVNRPADLANLSDLEKKHLPVITAPAAPPIGRPFDVTIEVGKLLGHANEPGHFIQFIELWADATFLGRLDLTAAHTCPRVTLCVILPYPAVKLRALARCNLHGLWIADRVLNSTR